MKSKLLIASLFAVAASSGCVKVQGNFCDIAAPIYFKSDGVVDWLDENDPDVLTGIIIHNEQVAAICP